jgi:quercetin dioxygenase-like cupin family protein
MIRRLGLGLAFGLTWAALSCAPALAADPPASGPPAPIRNIVQRGPVTGAPNEELVIAAVTFPAGGLLAYHTHPGEESGVVMSGLLKIEVAGQPPLMLGPGQTYLLPRGTRHQASSPNGETHVTAVYVVDKDKPLATPAP